MLFGWIKQNYAFIIKSSTFYILEAIKFAAVKNVYMWSAEDIITYHLFFCALFKKILPAHLHLQQAICKSKEKV